MSFHVVLDPPAAISGRVALDLNSGAIAVGGPSSGTGIDWGDAAIAPYFAEQQYGQTPVSFRVPNRNISIPLGLGMNLSGEGEEEARRKLNEKVALILRQGGVLLRQRGSTLQNLVLNPSFEYGLTGVGGAHCSAGATYSNPSTGVNPYPGAGTLCLGVTTTAVANEGASIALAPIVAGTYQWAIRVRGTPGVKVNCFCDNLANEASSVVEVTISETWQTVQGTWTTTALSVEPVIVARHPTASAALYYVDAITVVSGVEQPASYFDGDTPGYRWLGTPGDSVSDNSSEPLYADIVNATLTLPDVWGETGAVEPNVVLKLECLPDWYGEEITLDAVEQTGQVVQVLQQGGKQAVIAGDYPARTRIVLAEESKHDQLGMLWGLRSTHYDADPSAALFFDAKDLTPINGAEVAVVVKTFSGKAIVLKEPQVGIWHPFLTTDLTAGADQLTHVGSYRVWGRIQGTPGSQAMSVRLAWSMDDATVPTYNAAVSFPDEGFMLVDLGEIRISESPVGEHWWRGVLQANAPISSPLYVDRLWLQPVDDGAGRLRATATPSSTLLSSSKEPTIGESNNALHAGKAWGEPTNIEAGHAGYAAGAAEAGTDSQALVAKAMGFALPGGSTVTGISVTLGGVITLSGPILTLKMLKAGVLVGTEKSSTVSSGTVTFGGVTDLWGTTWTPAQVNEATFGVVSWITASLMASNLAVTTIAITVYYSYSSGAIREDAVLYSERQSEVRFDGAFREDTTTGAYVGVSQLTGDLPRLPPSGLEGRAVELFVKNSRGDLTPNGLDNGIDHISAVVRFRPCYIGRL